MVLTAFLTIGLAGLAMLPGLLLMRGSAAVPGQLAAAAAASLVIMLLATALLGVTVAWLGGGGLHAIWLAAVSAAAALVAGWRVRGHPWHFKLPEWQAIAFVAAFVGYGLLAIDLAFARAPDGALLVHSWYNADWFKHMGHIHALANYGVPARDLFGNAGPLHYYWLIYTLPGAAAAAGGDAWTALAATNSVVTALFSLCLYGVLRSLRLSPNLALATSIVAILMTAPMSFTLALASGHSVAEVLSMDARSQSLLLLATVIPQHALVLTTLLAWLLLVRPGAAVPGTARWLGLAALTAVMTISILLGAMVLATYGVIRLWSRNLRAIPELALAAVIAGGLVLMLGVLDPGNAGSAMESPLFHNLWTAPWYARALSGVSMLLGATGLALPVALVLLRFWKADDEVDRLLRRFSIALLVVGFGCAILTCVFMPARIAEETVIRARLILGLGCAVPVAWAVRQAAERGRLRAPVAGLCATLLAFGIPSAVVHTAWLADFKPHWTVSIPAADRAVLAALRSESTADARVWQFAEQPWAAIPGGGDMWAAIFAGRAVPNSLRATDYAKAAPYIAHSERFFAGDAVGVPTDMDWVYLSRALHPGSYDGLVIRMRADAGWSQRACYADACVFVRRRSARL